MKQNIRTIHSVSKWWLPVAVILIITSCNKSLPDATPIVYPPSNNSDVSIGALINTDPTFSIFKSAAAKYQAATKVDLIAQLSDTSKVFTAFIPNDAAFLASGFPDWDAVNTYIPLTSLAAILQYSIIPGVQYLSSDVATPTISSPNMQLPTLVNIGVLPPPAPPATAPQSRRA